jgi:hypothetical protein
MQKRKLIMATILVLMGLMVVGQALAQTVPYLEVRNLKWKVGKADGTANGVVVDSVAKAFGAVQCTTLVDAKDWAKPQQSAANDTGVVLARFLVITPNTVANMDTVIFYVDGSPVLERHDTGRWTQILSKSTVGVTGSTQKVVSFVLPTQDGLTGGRTATAQAYSPALWRYLRIRAGTKTGTFTAARVFVSYYKVPGVIASP